MPRDAKAQLGYCIAMDLRDHMAKYALDIGEGGRAGKWLAGSPVARLATTLGLTAPITAGPRAYENPDAALHAPVAEELEAAKPKELENTKLRYGGSDLVDDLLWKRDAGSSIAERLGGRVWHNPHTGFLGKLLGTATALPMAAYHNLTRSSHYNPFTDTATNYWNSPAVTSHLLGHAIDFNKQSPHPAEVGEKAPAPAESAMGPGEARPPEEKQFNFKDLAKRMNDSEFMKRLRKKLRHDVKGVAGATPGPNVYFEARANRASSRALEDREFAGKDKVMEERARQLPALMGNQIGGAAGLYGLGTPTGMYGGRLAGLLGGKAYGSVAGDIHFLRNELANSARGIYDSVKRPVERVGAMVDRMRGRRKAAADLYPDLCALLEK